MSRERNPLVFDLRFFSLDDGPGIRTTVFLKGCPLSCAWCHNPEGRRREAEIVFHAGRCIGCNRCIDACPEKALVARERNAPPAHDTDKCRRCGACADACPANARSLIGRYYAPEELVDACCADRLFYQKSGGGVTFSGGEPCLFPEYVGEVARGLKKNGIHTAVETSGYFDYGVFEACLLPFVDLVLYDLKLIDPEEFRRHTGGDARRPVENFLRLCGSSGAAVVATIPLVPGITATERNLGAIADLLRGAGCRSWLFRPYHPGGLVKRELFGTKVPARTAVPAAAIGAEEERAVRSMFRARAAGEPVHG